MKKYKIHFENLSSGEQRIDTTFSSDLEVIEQYKKINWFELLTKATDENKGNSDIIDDNSWNFAVKFKKNNKEYLLHINPHLYPSPSVKHDELKLVVEFREYKIVPTSKLTQFFGGSKEKAVEQAKTNATDLLQKEVLQHLDNFLNTNHMGLKKLGFTELDNMIDQVYKVY